MPGAGIPRRRRRRDPEYFLGIAVGNRQQVSVKVHRGLGLAGRAGGEGEEGDVVTAGRNGFEPDRLGECNPVELRIVIGGAVEADDLIQEAARLGAGNQLVHHPGVAKGEPDPGLLDDLRELPGAQHRHGVHHHRPRLGGREPAADHGRVVGRANQDPVAWLDPEVLAQRPGQAIGPVGQLLVGAPPAVPDEGDMVAEPGLYHPIGELEADIQALRVVERAGEERRPPLRRRQVVAREGVHVRRRSEQGRHAICPPCSWMKESARPLAARGCAPTAPCSRSQSRRLWCGPRI